jgi:transcriptional regulator with XRE-family HTH domain
MAQTRLKQLREEAVLTVHELAEASGVSDDTISKIENGQRVARPSTLRKLAGALDVSPQELRRPAKVEEPIPLAEAPREAGPAQTMEQPRERGEGWEFRQAIELVMEAARKAALRTEQATNRAFESDQPQGMFTNELMDAGRRILDELEPASMMEALRELAFEQALLERRDERLRAENSRLRADLTGARELLREREQAYRELEEKSHS